jgi:hypothetical protein
MGQCIAGLLADAGLLYGDHLRDGQREFEPKKKMIKSDQGPNKNRNKSLGVICKKS